MIHFKNNRQFICIIFSAFLLFSSAVFSLQSPTVQKNNIIEVPEVISPPVINGRVDDVCWQKIDWQTIDQVWMPYGAMVDPKDYSGRYKIVWSSKENLLYFLVEITDDVFVDGYVQGKTADIYNFDLVEVFIDEDKSGGFHVFDGSGDTGRDWGTNAENAFAYHLYADFPDEGEVATKFRANDQDGTDWSNVRSVNYASHFPEFALRKNKNQAVWEFSLFIYNDTYEDDNADTARVKLKTGKEMGLSLAYCDNDDPNEEPKTRDNFFGSVWVPEKANNDHWKNASDFGTVRLISNIKGE